MDVAVRYFSTHGNTKAIAEEIAQGVGVKAVSIVDEPELDRHYDVLYLGGAPYFNIMAPELRAYAEGLDPEKVGKVVLFTTSNWSRRTILALRTILKAKRIPVVSDHFWSHMTRIDNRRLSARVFGEVAPQLDGSVVAVDKRAVAVEAVTSVVIVATVATAVVLVAKQVGKLAGR